MIYAGVSNCDGLITLRFLCRGDKHSEDSLEKRRAPRYTGFDRVAFEGVGQ